ncbi:MAG: FecR domain-containing protein [Pseudomonadota bacterium]
MSPGHEPEPWLADRGTRGQPTPAEVARLDVRVAASLARPRPTPTRWPLFAASALTAAAVVLVMARAPRPLEQALQADAPTSVELSRHVHLTYAGAGQVSGSDRQPVIAWTLGHLEVDVTPGAGVHLAVVTEEARADVLGTRFSVARDALGTRITVQEGRVSVACRGAAPGEPGEVAAGTARLCLPGSPSGLLGRARALEAHGDLAASEEAVDQGLVLADPVAPARGELLALALRLCLARGDTAGAAIAARAYLDGGFPARADEIRRTLDDLEGATP